MKYLQDGTHQNQPLVRLSLTLTMALLVGFWVTNFAMYFSRMGLDPATVVAYYNGSEAEFRSPRTLGSMLETSHAHLPMMAVVLLLLTHLLIFVPVPRGAKVGLIACTFVFAALDEGGGWLVRFVSPALAPVKLAGFLGLQACLGLLLAALLVSVMRSRRFALVNGANGANGIDRP